MDRAADARRVGTRRTQWGRNMAAAHRPRPRPLPRLRPRHRRSAPLQRGRSRTHTQRNATQHTHSLTHSHGRACASARFPRPRPPAVARPAAAARRALHAHRHARTPDQAQLGRNGRAQFKNHHARCGGASPYVAVGPRRDAGRGACRLIGRCGAGAAVGPGEVTELTSLFHRTVGKLRTMSSWAFMSTVLGDAIPRTIANRIRLVLCAGSDRAITFQDYLCGAALFHKGTPEERIQFVFQLYDADGDGVLSPADVSGVVAAELATGREAGCAAPRSATADSPLVAWAVSCPYGHATFEEFFKWVLDHRRATMLIEWAFTQPTVLSREVAKQTTPTLHESLSAAWNFDVTDVERLEEGISQLCSSTRDGMLNGAALRAILCPPLTPILCDAIYAALGKSSVSGITFRDLVRGLSSRSADLDAAGIDFFFRICDVSCRGCVEPSCLRQLYGDLLRARLVDMAHGRAAAAYAMDCASAIHAKSAPGATGLTRGAFEAWARNTDGVAEQLRTLVLLIRATFGLRPRLPQHEMALVRIRQHRDAADRPGDARYIVSAEWWRAWCAFTGYPTADVPPTRAEPTSSAPHTLRQPDRPAVGADNTAAATVPAAAAVVPEAAVPTIGPDVRAAAGPEPARPVKNAALVGTDYRRGEKRAGVHFYSDVGPLLIPDLTEGDQFVTLVEPAWRLIHMWYGSDVAIVRRLVPRNALPPLDRKPSKPPANERPSARPDATATATQMLADAAPAAPAPASPYVLDLYPPIVHVYRHSATDPAHSASAGYASTRRAAGSSAEDRRQLRRQLAFDICVNRFMRVRELIELLSRSYSHEIITEKRAMRMSSKCMRLWLLQKDPSTQQLLEASSTLDAAGVTHGTSVLAEVQNADLSWPEELSSMADGTPAAGSPAEDAAHSAAAAALTATLDTTSVTLETLAAGTYGMTGLTNMGNTCYLSSALQCIGHVRPLVLYFLRQLYRRELNPTNPLGMKGEIATVFGDLLMQLWVGQARTIAPWRMRQAISKYAPHFVVTQQQDTQEVMAFLLDGLHEDLNRVTDRAYVEMPDSEGRPDEQVAAEWWENHRARNSSIIVDLFHGQLRSKVRCCECGYTNVKFDPFTFLTLPLPVETRAFLDMVLVRNGPAVPCLYTVTVAVGSTVGAVIDALAQLCGVAPAHLLLCRLEGRRIAETFTDLDVPMDSLPVSQLYAYECAPMIVTQVVAAGKHAALPSWPRRCTLCIALLF